MGEYMAHVWEQLLWKENCGFFLEQQQVFILLLHQMSIYCNVELESIHFHWFPPYMNISVCIKFYVALPLADFSHQFAPAVVVLKAGSEGEAPLSAEDSHHSLTCTKLPLDQG